MCIIFTYSLKKDFRESSKSSEHSLVELEDEPQRRNLFLVRNAIKRKKNDSTESEKYQFFQSNHCSRKCSVRFADLILNLKRFRSNYKGCLFMKIKLIRIENKINCVGGRKLLRQRKKKNHQIDARKSIFTQIHQTMFIPLKNFYRII